MNRSGSHYRRVHARVVLVEAHDRFHHARVFRCGLRIEIHHYATQVRYRDTHGWRLIAIPEYSSLADKWNTQFAAAENVAGFEVHQLDGASKALTDFGVKLCTLQLKQRSSR